LGGKESVQKPKVDKSTLIANKKHKREIFTAIDKKAWGEGILERAVV
jgi:hypothetical protein